MDVEAAKNKVEQALETYQFEPFKLEIDIVDPWGADHARGPGNVSVFLTDQWDKEYEIVLQPGKKLTSSDVYNLIWKEIEGAESAAEEVSMEQRAERQQMGITF